MSSTPNRLRLIPPPLGDADQSIEGDELALEIVEEVDCVDPPPIPRSEVLKEALLATPEPLVARPSEEPMAMGDGRRGRPGEEDDESGSTPAPRRRARNTLVVLGMVAALIGGSVYLSRKSAHVVPFSAPVETVKVPEPLPPPPPIMTPPALEPSPILPAPPVVLEDDPVKVVAALKDMADRAVIIRRAFRHEELKEKITSEEDRKTLQRALNLAEKAGLEVDGKPAKITMAAVAAFQKAYGIPKSAEAGPRTFKALVNKIEGKVPVYVKPRPLVSKKALPLPPIDKEEDVHADSKQEACRDERDSVSGQTDGHEGERDNLLPMVPAQPTPPPPSPSLESMVGAMNSLAVTKREFDAAVAAFLKDKGRLEEQVHTAKVVADSNATLTGGRSTFSWTDADTLNAREKVIAMFKRHRIPELRRSYEAAYELHSLLVCEQSGRAECRAQKPDLDAFIADILIFHVR